MTGIVLQNLDIVSFVPNIIVDSLIYFRKLLHHQLHRTLKLEKDFGKNAVVSWLLSPKKDLFKVVTFF